MQILTALDHEWSTLGDSRVAKRALVRWALAEPVLAGHDSPAGLLVACRSTGVTLGHPVLAALCRLGADDSLARRAALQLCMPVIARRSRSLWRARGGQPDLLPDVEAEAVAAAVSRIVDLGTAPALRPIYAVEGSVRKALAALTRGDHRNQGKPFGPADPPAPEPDESLDDAVRLISEAVRGERLSKADASLVLVTRTGVATIQDLAVSSGEHYKVLSRRRDAAEATIKRWAA